MIRLATQEDGKEIANLLWEIFVDMELPLLRKISKDKLLEMVAEAVVEPTYRFGFKRGLIYELEGEIAGIIFGYPAVEEPIIDKPFGDILKMHGYNPMENLFLDRETFPNEWYLDSIVVKKKFRGMGIGSILLAEMERMALNSGFHTIGLNVDISNPKAKKLYSILGYMKKADIIISGHHYEHMCKTLT